MFKHLFITLLAIFLCVKINAQTLTQNNFSLEECLTMAQHNYPLIKKYKLIEESKDLSLNNINKNNLPQINIGAKFTVQSETISSPFLKQAGIKPIPKEQYANYINIEQKIWDGGDVKTKKEEINNSSEIASFSTDAQLYTIKEQVVQLFFGIILINQQLINTANFTQNLMVSFNTIKSMEEEGNANGYDLDLIEVEILKQQQYTDQLKYNKSIYLNMLQLFTNCKIDSLIVPQKHNINSSNLSNNYNNRPEISVLDAKRNQLLIQESGIKKRLNPKILFYGEFGAANPAYNFFKPGYRMYGIGGVKLTWNLSSLYIRKDEISKIAKEKDLIGVEQDVFIFNNNLKLLQQNGEIVKLNEIVKKDEKIVELKSNIMKISQLKFSEGILSSNDLVKEQLSYKEALDSYTQHQIQLIYETYKVKLLFNNL